MEKKCYLVEVETTSLGEGTMRYNHRSDLLVVETEGSTARIKSSFCLGDKSGGQQVRPLEDILPGSFTTLEGLLELLRYSDETWRRGAHTIEEDADVLRLLLTCRRSGVAVAILHWLRQHVLLEGNPPYWKETPSPQYYG